MTYPAPAALRDHARALARAFDCTLIETADIRPEDAAAHPGLRVAVCAPIIDETTYAVALHEIGHLAAPAGVLRAQTTATNRNLQRDEEDAAWAWARHYALLWTPLMDAVARWAESTYAPAPAAPRQVAPTDRIDWTKFTKRR